MRGHYNSQKIGVLGRSTHLILVVKRSPFGYNFTVVDSQKSPTNRHAPSQFLELVRQGKVAFLARCAPAAESIRPGRNEPAFFAMKSAGEEPSPRPAVRDGMKQETLRVPVVEPRIKESGVGRDFPAAQDDVRILPQAPALLHEDEFSRPSGLQRAWLRGDVAPSFAWKKLRG
jgi:hypothetical protein